MYQFGFEWLKAKPWLLAYDNEPVDDPAADKEAADKEAADKEAADKIDKEKEKLLPQSEVNRLLAADRRKHEKTINQHIKQLEDLKNKHGASEQMQETLQARIEELQNTLLTSEELKKKERRKLEEDAKSQAEKLTSERNTWKSAYEKEKITNSILNAASVAEVHNEQLIVELLLPKTRLTEVLDKDGKFTGDYMPKVKLPDYDKDGHPTTLDLPVTEALKRMKERPLEFAGLFKSGVTGGLGGTSGRAQAEQGFHSGMTPAQYQEWRKKQTWARKRA